MKFLIAGLFRLLNLIPDRWAVHLANGISGLLVRFNTDIARVSRINIAHCFPDLDKASQDDHVRASLTHATLLLFEFAYLQYRPIAQLLERISGVDGVQRLQRARSARRVSSAPNATSARITGIYGRISAGSPPNARLLFFLNILC